MPYFVNKTLALLLSLLPAGAALAQEPLQITVVPDSSGLFFVDSINIAKVDLVQYAPNDISSLIVLKGEEA